MTVHANHPPVVPAPRARTTGGSSGFTASWPSAAAWGAGLIQLALGAAAIVGPSTTPPTAVVGALLVVLGLASFVWGAVNLSQARLIHPPTSLAGSMGGILAMFALLALAPAHTSVYSVAAGTLLLLVVGATCAVVVRRGVDHPRDVGHGRALVGLLLAAALLSLIVTPSLGATQDATLLRDDGSVPVVVHDGH